MACIIKGHESAVTQRRMMAHLHDLISDASNHAWPNVRNYHAVLLNQFEMNRLSWEDTAQIQQLRQLYAHSVFPF